MQNLTKTVLIALCCLWFANPTPALSQVQINLGSDEQVFNVLRRQGYTNPKVTKRSLTIIRTEACKGGKKYQVNVSILGRITSRSEIGSCQQQQQQQAAFSERQVRKALRDRNYTNIETRCARGGVQAIACRNGRKFEIFFNRQGGVVARNELGACARKQLTNNQIIEALRRAGFTNPDIVERKHPNYVADACSRFKRYRLQLNANADITNRRIVGDCGRPFSVDAIAGLLGKRGFNDVKITRRNSTPYLATACRNNEKFEIAITRRGVIQREKRIGTCRQDFDARNLASLMQRRGYDRIKIIRSNRTPYIAEGCKGSLLQEVQVGRFGDITREYRIGKCTAPMTRDTLAASIRQTGGVIVSLNKVPEGWAAQICKQDNKVLVSFDPYGRQTGQRPDGTCRSETVLNVLRTLESRGARNVRAFVEGCFDGGKYRWSFDRLGNRTDRARVGSC